MEAAKGVRVTVKGVRAQSAFLGLRASASRSKYPHRQIGEEVAQQDEHPRLSGFRV